jgi:hypothetical protein
VAHPFAAANGQPVQSTGMRPSDALVVSGLLFMTLSGLFLLRIGWRGRRVGADPHCGRCGYNLTGLPGSICPECGIDVSTIPIVRGSPRRRYGLLVAGLATLAGSLPVLLGFCAYRARQIDWYRYRPTFLVLKDARSSIDVSSAAGFDELLRRLTAGTLSASQVQKVTDAALQEEARPTPRREPLRSAIAILNELYARNRLSESHKTSFFRNRIRYSLEARPIADVSDGIPVQLVERIYGDMPGMYFETVIDPTPGSGRAVFPGGRIPPVVGGAHMHRGGSGCTPWTVLVDRLGAHEVSCRVTTRIYTCHSCEKMAREFEAAHPGMTYHSTGFIDIPNETLLYEGSVVLAASATVVPHDDAGLVGKVHAPGTGAALRQAIRIEWVRRSVFNGVAGLAVMIGIRPPVGVAFDCTLDTGKERIAGDPLVWPKGEGVVEARWFPTKNADIERVTLTLVPNPELVRRRIDITEIWAEPIRFENLTVAPAITPATLPGVGRP